MENNYAIIPARSGSKGVIDKNVKLLNNKPLCFYTIETALKSKIFAPENIIFSSDSKIYCQLVNDEFPEITTHLRSSENATDTSSSADMVNEVFNNFNISKGKLFLLQPTSPLRSVDDIINANEIYNGKNLVSTKKLDHSAHFSGTPNGKTVHFENITKRRQELKDKITPNGAIFIVDIELFRETQSFYLEENGFYLMSENNSIDIDTIDDFKIAECLVHQSANVTLKRVITYGTFDILHYGHINLLREAKKLGDYLVVALSTDEFNKLKNKKSYYDFATRKMMLQAIKYVDEIIMENTWEQKTDDIKKHNIDTFVIGDDWKGHFDFLKDQCEVVYLSRTKGISTTMIKAENSIE